MRILRRNINKIKEEKNTQKQNNPSSCKKKAKAFTVRLKA